MGSSELPGQTSPRTFISYSHDSEQHKTRVLRLADRLCRDGVDAMIDLYEPSPREGWPQWMLRQIQNAEYCLVVATETYKRRAEGREEPGTGRGARWESQAITQELYQQEGGNSKFLAVIFNHEDAQHIPSFLKTFTFFDVSTEAGYEDLLRLLTRQPRHVRPAIGEIPRLSPVAVLPAAEATQEIERSVVAYSDEEADDITVMHDGFFQPWLAHLGHYELRVRPRDYVRDRIDRMMIRQKLIHFRVDSLNEASGSFPFKGHEEFKNFLVAGSEGVESALVDLEARAYEFVRLHRSGQFRAIRHMPDDFKGGRIDEIKRDVAADDLVVTVSLMWLLAGVIANDELRGDEVADVMVRVDGLARRRMEFGSSDNVIAATLAKYDSHEGTKNDFVWTGTLRRGVTPAELLTQAAEELQDLMWSFGLADASLTIRRAQRASFGANLVPLSAAEAEHEAQLTEFLETFRKDVADVSRLEPPPLLSAEARIVWPDEARRLGLGESGAARLAVFIKNGGRGPATNVVVHFEGFRDGAEEHHVGPLGPSDSVTRLYYCPRYSAGAVPNGSVPERIVVRYDGMGWRGGACALGRIPGSHPPVWCPEPVTIASPG